MADDTTTRRRQQTGGPAQCLSLVPLPPNTSRVAIFRQATMTATQDAPARTRVHNGWGEEDAGWVTTWYRLVSSRVGSLPASATVVPACGRSTSPLVREPLSSCSARRRPGALGDTEAGDRGTCRNEKKVGEREEGKGWGGEREKVRRSSSSSSMAARQPAEEASPFRRTRAERGLHV